MGETRGKEIANNLVQLNFNLLYWARVYLNNIFCVNGKDGQGELTMQQFHFLIFIRTFECNTISEIATELGLSKSSVSLSISKLVKKGYLEKQQACSFDDGRKAYFLLTPKGEEVLDTTKETLLDTVGEQFAKVDVEKQEKILYHLLAVNELLFSGGVKK